LALRASLNRRIFETNVRLLKDIAKQNSDDHAFEIALPPSDIRGSDFRLSG
jgi:hypothetical protein